MLKTLEVSDHIVNSVSVDVNVVSLEILTIEF